MKALAKRVWAVPLFQYLGQFNNLTFAKKKTPKTTTTNTKSNTNLFKNPTPEVWR